MASPTLSYKDFRRQSAAAGHQARAAAAQKAVSMLGAVDDSSKQQLLAEGVRGRFHGVRKSLVLGSHSLKDLIGDDDVDVHDRTVQEREKEAKVVAHPLADPSFQKIKSLAAGPVSDGLAQKKKASLQFSF